MNEHTGRWVGIDISKSNLDVALLEHQGKVKSHVFANDAKGHAALVNWLIDRGCQKTDTRLCMEATGPYSEAPAIALSDAGWQVSVVNPARVKGFAQGELRHLRGLVDRLQSLKEMHQQEANRQEAAMNQPVMQASIQSHMAWLQASIKELEKQIDNHIDSDRELQADAELIASIPGIGATTAAKALAYLGDVRRFKNAKALAAFIGVTPRQKQSGTSVRGRSMISRPGHACIHQSLYMPAMVALKHNLIIKAFGLRLKETGMVPKAVSSASMHKLVRLI